MSEKDIAIEGTFVLCSISGVVISYSNQRRSRERVVDGCLGVSFLMIGRGRPGKIVGYRQRWIYVCRKTSWMKR
jgi:hypothetical protein